MELVNLFDYDESVDVLYITFSKGTPGIATETYDNIFIRKDPNNDKVIGITIMNFKELFLN